MMGKKVKYNFYLWVIILILFVTTNYIYADNAISNLTLLGSPTFIVEPSSNSSSNLIFLRNDSLDDINISLFIEDFKSKITGKLLGTKITFKGTEDKVTEQIYELSHPLKPGNILIVRVDITNLWEAGQSEAVLLNNGEKVGSLTAIKYRLPFNVKLNASKHIGSKIVLNRKKTAELFLENNDSMTYPFEWELSINGISCSGSYVINPNEEISIRFNPNKNWFTSWFTNFFREEIKDSTLALTLQLTENDDNQYSLKKIIPIKAHLSYWAISCQNIVGTVIIFMVLASGGISSLMLYNWIPNRMRQLALKEKLALLANKTRDLSRYIDSRLRVGVRVERHRLFKVLVKHKFCSLELARIITQCDKRAENLRNKIELLKQIDMIFNRMIKVQSLKTLPTYFSKITRILSDTSDLLSHSELKEGEFQAAQAQITEAWTLTDKFGKPDQNFAQELANRIKIFREKFSDKGSIGRIQICKRIKDDMPGLFKVLNLKFLDPAKISPDDYSIIDIATFKLAIIRDFVLQVEDMQQADVHLNQLKSYLNLESWSAIHSAQLLIQQIKEGIFPDDIRRAIQLGNKAISIDMDPQVVRLRQPVKLSLRFHREELNQSAASDKFEYEWNFGHLNLIERGKEVSHFFPEKKEYTVKVEFKDADGKPVEDENGQNVILDKKINVEPSKYEKVGQRTKVEIVHFLIALSIALIGLFAGAKEQMLKMDVFGGLIAVFLIGFGADTIKNLLTRRQNENQ